jgi:hypothetical protein
MLRWAKRLTTLGAVCAIIATGSADAAITQHADVGGFRTFQDLNTGRVWLDLNNFFNASPNSMIASAAAGGFTFATRSDVEQLLGSLPLGGGRWSTYKSIMGDAPNRELIWAVYQDGGDPPFGWAFAHWNYSTWGFADDKISGNVVQNANGRYADLNLWAYKQASVSAVPEPGSLTLLGAGVLGLCGRLRRRRQAA